MPALRTPRKYKGKPLGIPFSATEKGSTRYKLKLKIDQGVANFDAAATIEGAIDRYIIHYFPEFYIALYDRPMFMTANADPDGDGDGSTAAAMNELYMVLRTQLRKKTEIDTRYPTSPPSDKEIVIFSLRYDVFKAREQLTKRKFNGETEQKQMPSFEASLDYFNSENAFGPTESQAEFPIKKMSSISQKLQGAFTKFGKQQKRSKGPQVPMSVDFGFLGTSVVSVLSTLVSETMETVKGAGKAYKFREGDTLTLYFGPVTSAPPTTEKLVKVPDYAITDIKYLATDKSIVAEHLKVGHFSLVKYSQLLKDKVIIASLKNYNSVLKMDKKASKGPHLFSVDEFFGSALGIDTSGGFPLEWATSNDADTAQDDENNALINAAVDLGIIDIADTSALQVSIGAYTTGQLVSLSEAITKNPELYVEAFKGQEKKKDEASPDFLDQIQKVLSEGPMAAIDDNSPVGAFFRHFGIKTLVKEALLCLTFGMNFEIERIVAIIDEIKGMIESGNIVVEFGGSVQGVTKPQIPLPSLGDLSLTFPMFTITGDIWKMILEIVIESLEKALIQVIAQLVELLRQLCDFNNPRSRDYGDTNIRDLIPRAAPGGGRAGHGHESDSNPDMGATFGPYDPFKGSNIEQTSGLSQDEIYEYVEQLSIILSSMDVCILLTQPSASEEDLVQKILDFNLAYAQAPQVAENLNTFTAIIGFFAELAKVVDVTDLCNEIANEVATLNQDNICLTEDDIKSVHMDDVDNIETLLDILQNGLRPGVAGVPEVFKPNFECPDNPNYIEDPTFRKSIYETLNVLVETVELQFSYSSESIKNVLLESRLTTLPPGTDTAANAVAEAGLGLSPEWAPAPSKAMIDILKAIMQGFENVGQYEDEITACINDNQDVLDIEVNAEFIQRIPEVLDQVIKGMEIAFAAGGKMGGLIDTLSELSDAAENSSPGTPLISRKVFNKRFLREFENYIYLGQRYEASYDPSTLNALNPISSMNSTPLLFEAPSSDPNNVYTWNFKGYEWPSSADDREVLEWYFRPLATKSGGATLTGRGRQAARAEALKKFPSFADGQIRLVYPAYQSPLIGMASFQLNALFQGVEGASPAFREEVLSSQTGLTMDPFVQSVYATLCTNILPPGNAGELSYQAHKRRYASRRVFPMANALLTDYLFDYYVENGIFDAATLQSLNFFHNNENCQPGDTSDLLDVDGIINKMLRMFEKLACGSDLPARKKVRLALKYGMYLLFVQVHIAEFIIKNIFVFSATEIDELFSKQFVTLYMRAQIENSMANYLANIDESVRDMFINDLVELFQQVNQIEGGITDVEGNVVFNSGEKLPAGEATYNKIINYLIGERITDSKSAVNNAIKQSHPNANPKPLKEIFLRSIPAYEATGDSWAENFSTDFLIANQSPTRQPRLFITKSYFHIDDLVPAASQDHDDDTALNLGDDDGPEDLPTAPGGPGVHVAHHHGAFDSNHNLAVFGTHMNNDPSFSNHDGPYTDHTHDENPSLGFSWLPEIPIDPNDIGPISDSAPTAPDYILRYKFWLYFLDPNCPDPSGAQQERLYPLLPSDDRRPAYSSQDQFFDRAVTIEPDDPRLGITQGVVRDTVLTQEDLDFLMGVPEYNFYFNNVFNQGVLSMIPIIQNFYLTTKYFDEITDAMKPTKDACLNIVKNAIASDDKYDKTPDMSRDVVAAFTNTMGAGNPFESFAREFILIMLVKTPIDILKGILELIDPHVAISKLIKNITGQVFNIMSRVFDEILDSAEVLTDLGIDSGEKLLAIVLCLVDVVMKNPPGTSDPAATDMLLKQNMEAFFPRITAEGIDFLGSIMGMFMIPPSPLGILYLLLSLIKVEIPSFGVDTGDNAVVNSSDPSAPTDPDC